MSESRPEQWALYDLGVAAKRLKVEFMRANRIGELDEADFREAFASIVTSAIERAVEERVRPLVVDVPDTISGPNDPLSKVALMRDVARDTLLDHARLTKEVRDLRSRLERAEAALRAFAGCYPWFREYWPGLAEKYEAALQPEAPAQGEEGSE